MAFSFHFEKFTFFQSLLLCFIFCDNANAESVKENSQECISVETFNDKDNGKEYLKNKYLSRSENDKESISANAIAVGDTFNKVIVKDSSKKVNASIKEFDFFKIIVNGSEMLCLKSNKKEEK